MQQPVSNHLRLLWSKAMGKHKKEKARKEPGQMRLEEVERK